MAIHRNRVDRIGAAGLRESGSALPSCRSHCRPSHYRRAVHNRRTAAFVCVHWMSQTVYFSNEVNLTNCRRRDPVTVCTPSLFLLVCVDVANAKRTRVCMKFRNSSLFERSWTDKLTCRSLRVGGVKVILRDDQKNAKISTVNQRYKQLTNLYKLETKNRSLKKVENHSSCIRVNGGRHLSRRGWAEKMRGAMQSDDAQLGDEALAEVQPKGTPLVRCDGLANGYAGD